MKIKLLWPALLLVFAMFHTLRQAPQGLLYEIPYPPEREQTRRAEPGRYIFVGQ